MDVAIFGAGVAGLTSAITLHARGHRCRLYERTRQSLEAGMGFILMPEGIACLERLGVRLAGAWSGVALQRYLCRDAAGAVLQEQVMPPGARSFRRRDLIAALVDTLPQGGLITFDAALDHLEFDAAGRVSAAVVVSNGQSVRVQADLYVAADGGGSRARQALFPDWPAPQAPVLEVVGLARDDETRRWAARDFNKFHAMDGGLAVGVLPVDAEHVVWYLQFDAQRFPAPAEDAEECRDFLERLVGDWAHPIPSLLAHTDFTGMHLWRPVDTDLIPRFYRENLVLTGDAAHPLLPFTSRGVSTAMGDAVALAAVLQDGCDLPEALSRYSQQRRAHCAPYVTRGRELARHFLAPQTAEHVLLPIA